MPGDPPVDSSKAGGAPLGTPCSIHSGRPATFRCGAKVVDWPRHCPPHTCLVHALSIDPDDLLRRAYARPEMRGGYALTASLRCDAVGRQPRERKISLRGAVGT